MICEFCSKTLTSEEDVVMEQYGVLDDNGLFHPTEPSTIHHAECDDPDEDDDVSPVEFFHGVSP